LLDAGAQRRGLSLCFRRGRGNSIADLNIAIGSGVDRSVDGGWFVALDGGVFDAARFAPQRGRG
jgi:hypothetical protein